MELEKIVVLMKAFSEAVMEIDNIQGVAITIDTTTQTVNSFTGSEECPPVAIMHYLATFMIELAQRDLGGERPDCPVSNRDMAARAYVLASAALAAAGTGMVLQGSQQDRDNDNKSAAQATDEIISKMKGG